MIDQTKDSISLIFGAHFNALSIIQSLKALGVSSKTIYLVRLKGQPKLSAAFFNPDVNSLVLDINCADDLPLVLHNKLGKTKRKVLFFTDEQYLDALNRARENGSIPDFHFFVGSEKYLNICLDRFEFYEFIKKNDIAHVPRTINGDENPFKQFDSAVVLRPKRSWPSFGNQQRVRFVSSVADLHKFTTCYLNAGLSPNDWCFQELLSTESGHVLSVCGWYDESEKFIFCTRKILLHPEPFGVGDVVEILPEVPGNIIEKTETLLKAIEYEGPFELEWVLDRKTGTYKILEINPRYWMQHGLINSLTGHKIIGLYFGLDSSRLCSIPKMTNNIIYWVNPLSTLFRTLKGDLRGLKYYFSANSVSPIGFSKTLLYAPLHFYGKLYFK